jgi:hypothetical protein
MHRSWPAWAQLHACPLPCVRLEKTRREVTDPDLAGEKEVGGGQGGQTMLLMPIPKCYVTQPQITVATHDDANTQVMAQSHQQDLEQEAHRI